MEKVLLLGANGRTLRVLESRLKSDADIQLTLFARQPQRLDTQQFTVPVNVFDGDAANQEDLNQAITGQDVVVVGLGGPLDDLAPLIIQAMKTNHVQRLIFILGLGIYDEVPGEFGRWNSAHDGMQNFKNAARLIEASSLNYTILRPAWMSDRPTINYVTTTRHEPFRGTVVTRASIADYIVRLLQQPGLANRDSIGLAEPNTDGDRPFPFI